MSRSLVDSLRDQVAQHPERDALIFIGPSGPTAPITYDQLDRDARRGAIQMQTAGVQAGEVVILAFEHSYELVAAFWSSLYAGAVPTIFPYPEAIPDTEQRRARLRNLAAFTDARALICSLARLNLMTEWLAGGATIPLALDEVGPEPNAWTPSARDGEDLAYIQFSSGTTGQPKGVMLSHRAVLSNVNAMVAQFRFSERDISTSWLPLYHDMGLLTSILLPLLRGALSVTMSPSYWLRRPAVLFDAIHRYRGSMTWMSNFAFNHCLRMIRDDDLVGVDLSSWRIVGSGSEPVQAEALHRFAERFAPWGLSPTAPIAGYGMAENVVAVTSTLPETPGRVDHVAASVLQKRSALPVPAGQAGVETVMSCGSTFPGVQVRVVDEAGQTLPERSIGEILVGGTSLFSGYFRDPQRTAHAVRDGWFYTGDLGYLADGELYICDRKQDLIIIGGRNVFPESIEAVARESLAEQVRYVVAFGIADPALGTEAPVLVCEGRPGLAAESQAALAKHVHQRVSQALGVTLSHIYFAQRGWIVRTTSGKLARGSCRDKYLAEGHKPELPGVTLLRTAGEDPALLEQALTALFAEMLGMATVSPDANFFELGGDSLTALRMVLAVEEATGHQVPTDFFREPTVAHLIRLLIDCDPAPQPMTQSVAERAFSSAPPGRPSPDSWQRGFRSMPQWMRVRMRTTVEAQAFRHPYFESVHWLLRWCSRSWVQRVLYPTESHLVRRFAESMRTPATKINQEVALSLVGNILQARWREERRHPSRCVPITELMLALNKDSDRDLWDRHVSVEGADHLSKAIGEKNAVILVSTHSPLLFALVSLVERLRSPVATVSRSDHHAAAVRLGLEVEVNQGVSSSQARTAVAVDAYRALQRGWLVAIAGDERQAEKGIPVVIGDRLEHLSPGFATLASNTNAVVLPLFAGLMPDGRIRFLISPPLAWERESSGAVPHLVRQFGRVQTGIWQQAPSMVSSANMAQHLAAPKAMVHDG